MPVVTLPVVVPHDIQCEFRMRVVRRRPPVPISLECTDLYGDFVSLDNRGDQTGYTGGFPRLAPRRAKHLMIGQAMRRGAYVLIATRNGAIVTNITTGNGWESKKNGNGWRALRRR